MHIKKTYPYILIIGSIIGLLASFILTVDTIKLIKNPATELPCNINPFLSCTSVANTWQASVFGFPNPLLGIITFSMLLLTGLFLLFGGTVKKTFWLLINLGTLFATLFVVWFFYQSVFNIGSLCIYCMAVWAVTWPIFLYTTISNFKDGHLTFWQKLFSFVSQNHLFFLIGWYLIIIFTIFFKFKDFFLS